MKYPVFLLSLLLVAVPLGTAWAAPRIEIASTDVVIKEPVLAGETIQGVFEFTNSGDQDLLIERVSPG